MGHYDVLIVEDDVALCEALCETLSIEGYRVSSANNGTEAMVKLSQNQFKLAVSDVQMPVMDGLQLLQNIRNQHPDLPVVLMTAYGTIPKAVEAIQSGATDYLVKPFEAGDLVSKVSEFVMENKLSASDRVIQDPAMKKLHFMTSKVAKTDVTVLLQGESGTGKEVVAQYIHHNSLNHQGPFIAVNCAAIPENMLEAILFGHEKGAFTGAHQTTVGKFEQAQNGTLLLDEVSEMDLALQAKILRVLQERELERLGGQRKISLNVRVLATTNRTLKECVEKGRFREDLYYRLNVFPINIPALRDRPGDILPIAENFIKKYWQKGKNLPVLGISATKKLLKYSWPGNVRELENVIQRTLILHDGGEICASQILMETDLRDGGAVEFEAAPERMQNPGSLGDGVRSIEEKIILQTLQEENGSRKTTAEKLGISPRTLRYKIARMKESGVAVPC